jgi:ferredoxin like protein
MHRLLSCRLLYQGGQRPVTLITDGCLECGTCRVICEESAMSSWEYPRGGYGILFKFG